MSASLVLSVLKNIAPIILSISILVMQKMIEDIDFAIANLSATHSDYRVTKWTALALKSRFCLYEGTFRKYHAGDVTLQTLPADAKPYSYYLEQAVEAADQFIASSGYSIYNSEGKDASYIGLFTKRNVDEGVNKEVILARDYNVEYSVTHSANNDYQSPTLGKRGITRKIIASYLMKDGTRFTDKAGWETAFPATAVSERTRGWPPTSTIPSPDIAPSSTSGALRKTATSSPTAT